MGVPSGRPETRDCWLDLNTVQSDTVHGLNRHSPTSVLRLGRHPGPPGAEVVGLARHSLRVQRIMSESAPSP